MFTEKLAEYINACFSGIWVETSEPHEAERDICKLCVAKEWEVWRWDIAKGWGRPNNGGQDAGDPAKPLKVMPSLVKDNDGGTTIMVLHNFHKFISNPLWMQELYNQVVSLKGDRGFLIVLSPTANIPQELEKVFVVLEHDLPDFPARQAIAQSIHNCQPDGIIEAAAGLTHFEAEGAFALSVARHGLIKPDEIWELKASMLKKSGLLEMHQVKERFSDLGGLESLKSFCKKALAGSKVKPKGILLLGVPGTGKSAFAKALGNETGRPTLTLNMGALFGSLVGQTEERVRQALKIADAMAPCVLFVDEIEKALSGAGTNNDGGAATRMFGTLLSWLNDHKSDVFFIGTCNDISKLPPEFSRAERFDGIFFIDLPSKDEQTAIWKMYTERFGVIRNDAAIDTTSWTGAEIKACCRLAALLDTTLSEAAQNIVPIALTAADKVASLREWASGRCLSASTKGVYQKDQKQEAPKPRRRILT